MTDEESPGHHMTLVHAFLKKTEYIIVNLALVTVTFGGGMETITLACLQYRGWDFKIWLL